MAARGVIGFVRRFADPDGYARMTDRELLGRFSDVRDETAFETLVARHARLVRSAIVRVLVDPGDIDDATQATFLILVRRAGRTDWEPGLGPWLYGVAHRVAVRLRARNRRRPVSLGNADPGNSAPLPEPGWQETCDLLHTELDRLSDKYRLPLLLCYLEGQTRDEAAAALGVTTGTVKGRVRRGCELLRRRLARRGVSLSVGLLAAVDFACPPALTAAVIRGTPAPRVTELVLEVTRAMTPASNRLFVFGLVAAIGLVAAAGLVVGFSPEPVRPLPAAAPVPRVAPAAEFLVKHPTYTCYSRTRLK
ncbi:RNA polymerase sigma factor [Fimbriiglobus ruber]|uniref:High-affnity carbon uptake protein Hat/HatR n=1 Tax=Fimbriiglobus ruber TaxID=1908690 RepID=A0A225DFN6_9BACT|nr:sigma-70 family RNA polymerase sigma factor [Fimbriiglobus ruber]OWK40302.1 High-affnity carbon uptake protein Hat/HatR [Fimbriiglobus ruber]